MRRTLATFFCAMLLSAGPVAAETLLVGNKSEDTLSVIALAPGDELARLPTGKMPHEIAISPDGKRRRWSPMAERRSMSSTSRRGRS